MIRFIVLFLVIVFFGIVVFTPIGNISDVYIYKKDKANDEQPGVGSYSNKPDTCLAYYDSLDKKIHIHYLRENKNQPK